MTDMPNNQHPAVSSAASPHAPAKLSEKQLAVLQSFGWEFCQLGPPDWTWAKFSASGKILARQGDREWTRNIAMAQALGAA